MSLYDNPLPPADYAAYRALREEMCDLALPYLGHCLERQQTLREVGRYLESIDLDTATARLGETVCRVAIHRSRRRWPLAMGVDR